MMPLGTKAPDFTLPDTVSGKNVSLEDVKSDVGTVVMFICNHCPYVVHIEDELAAVAEEYGTHGFNFVAISSNDIEHYPADAPEKMKEKAAQVGYPFPYLYDATQEIAKAYMAACTPDIYVFDEHLKCAYRGRLDEATPGNGKPVNGQDLRAALDALRNGEMVNQKQFPSMGCNIKWK